jgi:hypothetical protein
MWQPSTTARGAAPGSGAPAGAEVVGGMTVLK